jgi:hypothetical protein
MESRGSPLGLVHVKVPSWLLVPSHESSCLSGPVQKLRPIVAHSALWSTCVGNQEVQESRGVYV